MEGDSLVLCLAKVHIPTYPQLNVGVLFPYSHDYIYFIDAVIVVMWMTYLIQIYSFPVTAALALISGH